MNTNSISMQGGPSGDIDGLIYAANAQLSLGGGPSLLHSQLLVSSMSVQGGWLHFGAE